MLFIRTNHGLIAHGDAFVKPDISDMIDYEGELAVIIGKAGRHISQADALGHLAGYSIFNDGSVRDWQRHTIQFCPGKNFEGTGPGNLMVTPDEFGDPYAQQLTTDPTAWRSRIQASVRWIIRLKGLSSISRPFTHCGRET